MACRSCKTVCYCLVTNGDGTVVSGDGSVATPYTVGLDTTVWPFACSKTNGPQLYKNALGYLVTVPEHVTATTNDVENVSATTLTQTVGVATVFSYSVYSVTNPSACRSMVVLFTILGSVTCAATPAGAFSVNHRVDLALNGGGFGAYAWRMFTVNPAPSGGLPSDGVRRTVATSVSPGGTLTMQPRVVVYWVSGTSAGLQMTSAVRLHTVGYTA